MSSPEEDALRKFVFEKVLNQGDLSQCARGDCVVHLLSTNIPDTRAKSVNLLGKIDSQPAILIAEKTAFNVEPEFLETFAAPSSVSALSLIQRNDIYHWFLASQVSGGLPQHAEAKLTLIYPATETHIRKYSSQSLRMITETPKAYRDFVLPYVASKRKDGRLNWVYNILDKKAESDTIIIEDTDEQEGFMLLPDLHVTRYP
jgi:m7GpppX diphosphatase